MAEALSASGIPDPYKPYKDVHPLDVGTHLGSGIGGAVKMFKTVGRSSFISTIVTPKGDVKYSEVACEKLASLSICCGNDKRRHAHVVCVSIQWTVVIREITSQQSKESLQDAVVKLLRQPSEPPNPLIPERTRLSSKSLRPQITGVTPVNSCIKSGLAYTTAGKRHQL